MVRIAFAFPVSGESLLAFSFTVSALSWVKVLYGPALSEGYTEKPANDSILI